MTKQEQIKADMITAMKNKDKDKKMILSYLVAQLKNVEIEKRRPLTDDEVNEVINKQIKQTQDVLTLTPSPTVSFATLLAVLYTELPYFCVITQ